MRYSGGGGGGACLISLGEAVTFGLGYGTALCQSPCLNPIQFNSIALFQTQQYHIQFNSIQFNLFPAHINISYSNDKCTLCAGKGADRRQCL